MGVGMVDERREQMRARILEALSTPENKKLVYDIAIRRSDEIQSGVCRVVTGLPEPEGCPCLACRGHL